MDARRPSSPSSSFCTTTTIALFVALCVVGAWMMTSSTVFPVEVSSNNKSEPVEVSSTKKSEVKDQRAEVDFGTTEETATGNTVEGSGKFEDTDNNDNVPDESHSNRDAPEEEKFTENAM